MEYLLFWKVVYKKIVSRPLWVGFKIFQNFIKNGIKNGIKKN